MLHLTGERNGPPVRPGLGMTDMSSGLFLHGAILAALYARSRTGRGQKLDTSLFETQVALLINVGMSWLNLGQEAERWGQLLCLSRKRNKANELFRYTASQCGTL